MYHKVPKEALNSRHKIYITQEQLKKHFEFFKKQKMNCLWFSDLLPFWDGEKSWREFPKNPLLLTFDDGYRDNLENALPLLDFFGLKANLFVLANHDIVENTWDRETGVSPAALLTKEEKISLKGSAFELASHGLDHVHLTDLSLDEAEKQIRLSKTNLESDLGKPIHTFAYPYGSSNLKLARICRRVGYRFAVNTDKGGIDLAENPHYLFRVNVFPDDGVFQIWKKTRTWYRQYFLLKRSKSNS